MENFSFITRLLIPDPVIPCRMFHSIFLSHQHQKDSWHIWRHLRKDIVFSCNLHYRLIFLHGHSRTYREASLCAGPVGRISYNLYFDCKHVPYVTYDLINEYTLYFNKTAHPFGMFHWQCCCHVSVAESTLSVWSIEEFPLWRGGLGSMTFKALSKNKENLHSILVVWIIGELVWVSPGPSCQLDWRRKSEEIQLQV